MNGGERKLLGRWGESIVAQYLRKKNYVIEGAGWHCRMGEIDLIASDGTYLCFVEVKLRKNACFAQAREAVDRRKQEKLRLSAQLYLAENPTLLQPRFGLDDVPARFDVAEVYAPEGASTKEPEIIYIENAF